MFEGGGGLGKNWEVIGRERGLDEGEGDAVKV